MTRISRGYIARRRRKKMRSFASGWSRSNLTRILTQHQIKALNSSYRDRNRKKINFRRLWITRINAVIRKIKTCYSYSKFINDLYKNGVIINRKILSQVAIFNKECLYQIYNKNLISNEIIKI
uniref:50S ribosomal protein L20 n=1 Tax=Allotropa virgata TaxID=176242 RepID=A0A221SQR7_9ERIC|nr:ribosomal protein L20 [Allotropa virgata]ASN78881.1 ribosomal protein L20 [Allotropa virgata]ASN78904.1 ribosomal protein L20 [Allotropa virgata]